MPHRASLPLLIPISTTAYLMNQTHLYCTPTGKFKTHKCHFWMNNLCPIFPIILLFRALYFLTMCLVHKVACHRKRYEQRWRQRGTARIQINSKPLSTEHSLLWNLLLQKVPWDFAGLSSQLYPPSPPPPPPSFLCQLSPSLRYSLNDDAVII